jgi:hypothetical protein
MRIRAPYLTTGGDVEQDDCLSGQRRRAERAVYSIASMREDSCFSSPLCSNAKNISHLPRLLERFFWMRSDLTGHFFPYALRY